MTLVLPPFLVKGRHYVGHTNICLPKWFKISPMTIKLTFGHLEFYFSNLSQEKHLFKATHRRRCWTKWKQKYFSMKDSVIMKLFSGRRNRPNQVHSKGNTKQTSNYSWNYLESLLFRWGFYIHKIIRARLLETEQIDGQQQLRL